MLNVQNGKMATPELLATGRYMFTQNVVRECLVCGRSYATQFVSNLDGLWVSDLNREQAGRNTLDKMRTFRARQVYETDDINARLREVVTSEVETVRLPMSYFAKDPVAFRKAFYLERKACLEKKQQSAMHRQPATTNALRKWGCMQMLSEEGLDALFAYKSDVLQQGSARNVDDIPIARVPVNLPAVGFPKFKVLSDYAESILGNRATRTGYRLARQWGLVRHTVNLTPLFDETPDRPWELIRYTVGLRFGDAIHHPDYLLGSTVVMTAERALSLVGREAFGRHWLFTDEDLVDPTKKGESGWFAAAHERLRKELPHYHYGTSLSFISFAKVD